MQKCFLERKRSYLTEKGLFSRKAPSSGESRSKNEMSPTGDRGFESISLQRRVACEPDFRGRMPWGAKTEDGTLAHELVHATGRHGHGSHFAKLARAIGLEGKMTATTEGEAFKQAVAPILEAVGPYPHAELSKKARTKQGTRLIKLQCPTCPYTVRITRKWLDEVGAPACPSHGDDMKEA